MITQRDGSEDINYTTDYAKPSKQTCQANVGTDIRLEACGKVLRRHKDDTLHCPDHGEMH